MKKTNYTFEKMKVSNLKVHGLLTEMGFDHQPTEYLVKALEKEGIYERPIVDKNGYVLSHCAEVLAAIENGVEEIEVCVVERSMIDMRFLILTKHGQYKHKALIKSYETAKFLREYFATAEGAEFADTLPGCLTEKIAAVMTTSESSVKRLLRVGDEKPEKLALIEQGETSLKEVLDNIKSERMISNQKKKEKEQTNCGESQQTPEESVEQSEEKAILPAGDNTEEDTPTENVVSTTQPSSYEQAVFSLNGFGGLDVSVTNGQASIMVNGKALKNLIYHSAVTRDSAETGRAETFTISQTGKKGISIQLTIENLNQAA